MQAIFQYHYSNAIYIIFFVLLLLVADIIFMIKKKAKLSSDSKVVKTVSFWDRFSVTWTFFSNISSFVGIPIDIISGVINAFFFIYVLYQKKIFKVTMLLSKENIYLISLLFCVILFSNLAFKLQVWMSNVLMLKSYEIFVFVGIAMLVMTIILYMALNSFLANFFLQEEQVQNDALANYTSNVTQLLRVNEILNR